MKIGYDNFWVEFEKESIIEMWNTIKGKACIIGRNIFNNIKRTLKICLIDGRYELTRYIQEYGEVKISVNNFRKHIESTKLALKPHYTLLDFFNENELLNYSKELDGSEDNTPSLNEFDFIIRM